MDETGFKAVVTGAAGFIGSHLADRLLQEGNEVLGYDNFDPYYPNKDRNLYDATKNPKFCLIKGDILDNEGLADAIRDSYVVFHEAAQAGVRYSIENPLKVFRTNLQGTINVLEAARIRDSPKLIFTSTSAVYGNAVKFPVSEKMEQKPISPYGLSKLLAEKICVQYSELYGMKVVILRYHNVYGPRQRPDNAIRKWITSLMFDKPIVIYGDGFQKRDFTYVDSIVDGTLKAALEKKAEGEIINLGSGAPVTVNETVSLLKKILNKPSIKSIHEARKLGDVNDTFADISKAKSILGYILTTSLEEGLRKEVHWCRQYG
jgi:UDP-glucose 4-epimerase